MISREFLSRLNVKRFDEFRDRLGQQQSDMIKTLHELDGWLRVNESRLKDSQIQFWRELTTFRNELRLSMEKIDAQISLLTSLSKPTND